MGNSIKAAITTAVLASFAMGPSAMARDISPTLLIETGPSDNSQYRRMVHVKYIDRGAVTANYRAYNRREFINVPNQTPANAIAACAKGQATTLADIKAFQKDEAKRKRSGQAPEIRSFCIKNVRDWTDRNKDQYLDPIFDSMPYIAK